MRSECESGSSQIMSSPTLSASQKETLTRILQSTPALFFGVTTADGPIYMHQEGKKLVDDPTSDSIDEDTVYWLCSQTKLITSQGKIAFDTPVESVFPELANPVVVTGHDEAGNPLTTPAKGKITLGLKRSRPNGLSDVYAHRDEDVAKILSVLKGSYPGMPLKFEPGTDFAYGFSTDCAGFIVERLSGKSLEQYFQDHIFGPLGITSASFYLTSALNERLLPLSYRTKSGVLESWKGPPVIDLDPRMKDYLTVLRHLLQIIAGTAATPILSRASVDSLFAPTQTPAGAVTLEGFMAAYDPHLGVPAQSAQFGRGLFVTTADVPGRRRAGSGSWGGWANTSYFVDPTTGVAAVFATQLVPMADDRIHRLYDALERTLYAEL
ncbi:beta-lactamase [Mycena leptocephala]|nr:beta-lactamase [Mycena leptocephala]